MTRDSMRQAQPSEALTALQDEALRPLVCELGALLAESNELDPLVRLVAQRVTEAVDGCDCDVYVSRDGEIRCLASLERGVWNADYEGTLLDIDSYPATGGALVTRELTAISSPEDPRLTAVERAEFEKYGRHSELCVPLVIDEHVVGLLDVFAGAERDFAESLDFVRSAGQLVAGAIANALLLDELERSNRDLRLLVECGRVFGSSLDPDAVLHAIAQTMRDASGAVCADLFEVVDGEGIRGLVSIDENGVDAGFPGTFYALDECLAARLAFDSEGRLSIPDAQTDPRLCGAEQKDFVGWGFHGTLGLPLYTGKKLLGVAMLYDRRVREFDRLELLEGLAQVAAQAIANASLHRTVVKSAERLAAVTEAGMDFSSSLTLEEVLDKTVRRIGEVVDVTASYVFKVRGDELVCVAAVRDNGPSPWLGARVPLARWGSSWTAVTTREPVVIMSVDDDVVSEQERRDMIEQGERCGLVVPLIAKERVIGTVELLQESRERSFGSDEIEMVRSICGVAALAIDNADLYRGLELRGRETQLMNEIARRTAASLDVSEIAAAVVEELRYLVPFDRAGLVLVNESGALEVEHAWNTVGALDELVASPAAGQIMKRLADEGVLRLCLPDDMPPEVSRDKLGALKSALFIRLQAGGTVIGGFGLVSERADAFARVENSLIDGIATHLSLAINNARMYGSVKRMHLANLRSLSWALNAKDYYTLGHAVRVSAYMAMMGAELGWRPEMVAQVEEASYLHDIGKIGISDQVLLKPGRLNDREWELMRHHPVYGADTIGPLFDGELVAAVRHHHERYDGSGYPDGLVGDAIPLVARAMGVADSYDAMSLRRPYRRALTYSESVAELKRCRGKQFDPAMTDAFLRVLARLEDKRKMAIKAAREAARQIDVGKHALLLGPGDEGRPEYGEIQEVLQRVRRKVVPDGCLTTYARRDGRFVFVVDGDDDDRRSRIGDEVFADQELPEAFAGVLPDMNALLVDQHGVWLGGRIPIMDDAGDVVAVVGADMPPMDTGVSALRKDVTQTLSTLLESGVGRFRRSEFEGITDGLTGLYTHRYFQERLSDEIERALLEGTTLSLLICDIDGFREFNQLRGHAAGDRALHEIARVIESTGRRIDLPARYGGEEFALVLIDAGVQGALEVAERIRSKVAATRLTPQGDRLTISVGMATAPIDARQSDELIDKAEWAMNLAKRQGRDCVAVFAEPTAQELQT